MRHGHGFRKLNVGSEHRRALMRNLATQLILRERIITTTAKAKELRKFVDPLITKAKSGTLQDYNLVRKDIFLHHLVIPQLFSVLGQRYQNRPGGYCRVQQLGFNEKSEEESVVELVDSPSEFTKAYREKAKERYATQLDNIMKMKEGNYNVDLLNFVYPFNKRIAKLRVKPTLKEQESWDTLFKQVVDKLQELKAKYTRPVSTIKYLSNVEITADGPVYWGSEIEPPEAPMKENELVKTKLVFHEKIVPEDSLRVRKRIYRLNEDAMKLFVKKYGDISVKEKQSEFEEMKQTVLQSHRKPSKREFDGYHVKITAVSRVELVPKPIEIEKELEFTPLTRSRLGSNGKNKHLR